VYIEIKSDYLNKTRKAAKKRADKNYGVKDNKEIKGLIWEDLDTTVDAVEVNGDTIKFSVSNDLGFFSFKVPTSVSIQVQICENLMKHYNKLKTVVEALRA